MEKTFKRYMVFAFDRYYPGGGLFDLEGDFDVIEDALAKCEGSNAECEFYQILDRVEGKVIYPNKIK